MKLRLKNAFFAVAPMALMVFSLGAAFKSR
jgi:hypothetical protein